MTTEVIPFSHPLREDHLAARYRVEGWPGVAVYIKGWTEETTYEGDYLVCEDEECDHDLSETCWTEGDYSIVEGEMLRVIMVGDDHEHIVDPEDLVMLADEDYCHVCGQLGCQHDGR
jgi:hypothetical protein